MLGTRIDSSVVVVECAFSVNLTALTIEQVLNKRHRLAEEMAAGMVLEVTHPGREPGYPHEGGADAALQAQAPAVALPGSGWTKAYMLGPLIPQVHARKVARERNMSM